MYSLDKFFGILNDYAPISISHKMIELGHYDNSGIIIKDHDSINKVLFSLDLTVEAVNKAKRNKCDTIVTHHPAIYAPLKTIDAFSQSAPVHTAIKNGMNVISMHLNLDLAKNGIDANLCSALGDGEYKILQYVDGVHGYGRQFSIANLTLSQFVKKVKSTFKTQRVLSYGNKNTVLTHGASFCGAGSSEALLAVTSGAIKGGVIVTADMPHHVITALIEAGCSIVLLPHYTAENYGFKTFYSSISSLARGLDCIYFEDRRFI